MRVDFVRHGQPFYSDEDTISGAVEGDLTAEGIKQIEAVATSLVAGFDNANDFLVIWSSPKRRARQTADIIYTKVVASGITSVRKPKIVWSLRDVILSAETFAELPDEGKAKSWMEYWSRAVSLPLGMEDPRDVRRRVMRVLGSLVKLARRMEGSTFMKRVRVVCVTHEETMRDLLEEAFGIGTILGTGPTYGESLQIEIDTEDEKNRSILTLFFRGMRSSLLYDNRTREIILL